MNRPLFPDHFSGHAAGYRAARPMYPVAFLRALAELAPGRACCWDAGCGNGQASVLLATLFDRVIATDPSANQIAEAEPRSNIDYRVEPAEASSLAPASVDFISVAQAYHWFDHARFADEVRRVARPGAVIAAYGYRHTRVSPEVDAIVARLYGDTLGADWPAERVHVDAGLSTLPFPFAELQPPASVMDMRWTAVQFLDYLRSWSAAQRYLKRTGTDAVAAITSAIEAAFGANPRIVTFDLFARVAFVR